MACCRSLRSCRTICARYWRLPQPRIAVCGLNPHAGEGGHLGDEELRVIAPGDRAGAGRRPCGRRPVAGRHAVRAAPAGALRRGARDVPRPGTAGAQARGLRSRGQRDAGAADRAHLGRSRHRARSGRQRPRRSGQPDRRDRAGRAAGRTRQRSRRASSAAARPRPQALRPALPARSGRDRAHRRGHRPQARRRRGGDRPRPRRPHPAAAGCRRSARCDRDRSRPRGAAAQPLCAISRASCCTRPTRWSWTGAPWPPRAARGCASSATCPTTSRHRCCFSCWQAADAILDMHVMLQREVVDRIVAAPGNRRLRPPDGDARARGSRVARCSTSARAPFSPRRKVASSVVRLVVLDALPRLGARAAVRPRWSRPPSRSGARRCATRCAAICRRRRSAPGHRPGCARRDARRRRNSARWRRRLPLCFTNGARLRRCAADGADHDRLPPHPGRRRPDRGQPAGGRAAP